MNVESLEAFVTSCSNEQKKDTTWKCSLIHSNHRMKRHRAGEKHICADLFFANILDSVFDQSLEPKSRISNYSKKLLCSLWKRFEKNWHFCWTIYTWQLRCVAHHLRWLNVTILRILWSNRTTEWLAYFVGKYIIGSDAVEQWSVYGSYKSLLELFQHWYYV